MNVTCPPGALPAVRAASRFAPARPPMPILGMALLRAGGSRLAVTATDLATGIEVACDARVHEGGAIALPARILAEIAASIPDEPVQIEARGATAAITAGPARFEILGAPADDFPALPEAPDGARLALRGATLASLIRATAYAASADDARPAHTGVLVTIEPGLVRFAATDGAGSPSTRCATPPSRGGSPASCPPAPSPRRPASSPRTTTSSWPGARPSSPSASAWRASPRASSPRPSPPTSRSSTPSARRPSPPPSPATPWPPPSGAWPSPPPAGRSSASPPGTAPSPSGPPPPTSAPPSRGWTAWTPRAPPLEAAFKAGYLADAVAAADAPLLRLALTGPMSPAAVTPADAPMPLAVIAPVRIA